MAKALDSSGIPYLLAGSFSSNYYGIPRSTQDADFVIQIGDKMLSTLMSHLGPDFHLERQLLFEGVTGTTRSIVTIAGTPFKIELFRLSDDPHDQERFRRRVQQQLKQCVVYLPTAEDVLVTKLRWILRAGRNKDRDDVRDVIAVRSVRIDWNYVHRWCDEHGTRPLLDEIRASIPPI
ncbi:MAG: nucleotidyl transferase AbiEii/AbiGii toxin family protein [Planctomycetales bacterium]